jgi:hypothetical protein
MAEAAAGGAEGGAVEDTVAIETVKFVLFRRVGSTADLPQADECACSDFKLLGVGYFRRVISGGVQLYSRLRAAGGNKSFWLRHIDTAIGVLKALHSRTANSFFYQRANIEFRFRFIELCRPSVERRSPRQKHGAAIVKRFGRNVVGADLVALWRGCPFCRCRSTGEIRGCGRRRPRRPGSAGFARRPAPDCPL